MNARSGTPVLFVTALLLVVGCEGRAPAGWTPVLEESPTGYLESEVTRALQRVATARGQLRSDPDAAEELLREAERDLETLSRTYLPLFQAKSRAYNAYRFHFLDRDEDAAAELDEIEETVVTVSQGAAPPLRNEMQRIEELLSDARLALEAGSPDAASALQRLAEALELMVLKGDLIF